MKRTVPISIIAILQLITGVITLFAAQFISLPASFPSWFYAWSLTASLSHILSAIALWRLSWLGPISYLMLWCGAFVVGHIMIPTQARPSIVGTAFSLLMLAIYCVVIFRSRQSLHLTTQSR